MNVERVEAVLREHARSIVAGALRAADPEDLVVEALRRNPPGDEGRFTLVAVGKASPGMARGARRALGDRIVRGVVVAPKNAAVDAVRVAGLPVVQGGHPLPDRGSVEAARAVADLVEGAAERGEAVLLLVSGGGSALLAWPAPGIGLEALAATTDLLLKAGGTIDELNTVRKHLERLKGGRLARLAAPAPLRALLLSDVPGDDPAVIASGPAVPDPTTWADAMAAVARTGVEDRLPAEVLDRLRAGVRGEVPETPDVGDPCFHGVRVELIGGVGRAMKGAARAARELGYEPVVESEPVTGEAREVGAALGRAVRGLAPGMCLVRGGETTVTVRGSGRGGRNQEVALGAVEELAGVEGGLLLSFGTDGVDGPTEAAGALATGTTLERALRAGMEPADFLARNDSNAFFRRLGDRVVTGPTGTNVMDVMVGLRAP